MKLEFQVEGIVYEVEISGAQSWHAAASRRKQRLQSSVLPTRRNRGEETEKRVCRSPVNGIVSRVHIRAGESLRVHDPMLVLEAMKMETRLEAPVSGKLKRVHVAPGDAVKTDQVLVEFE
jgi:biotin carboxyl carrier protein